VRAGNQKGRVERAIRYVRDSFWAGRIFTTLAECNRQVLTATRYFFAPRPLCWRNSIARVPKAASANGAPTAT
jgi:hypothetical protein